jgi:multicomponent K+:H+ antiporter subunit A
MDLLAIVAAPFALAGCLMLVRNFIRTQQQGWLLSGVFVMSFVFLLSKQLHLQQEGALTFSLEWMPQIGLALSLYVDGLALLFALLVTGIASAVFFYAGHYLEDPREAGYFFALLLAFTGSMLLLVMAGNLLTLFIAWELTSIISFLLISFKGKDADARRGASQALVITGGGGLALLVGLLLAGTMVGSMEFATILTSGELLRQSPFYTGMTLLILLGCFSKSAQFPLHFWLPQAMSAPTPASAFLHSATMVKAGVYLLLRFYPVLGDTVLWTTILTGIGLTTMLIGGFVALYQQDLKGMLAFSTISQLGALVALIGQPDSEGLKAALVTLLAHALYKCALFLVVGAIDHATGTRNINKLGGLHREMRGFAVVTFIAGLSMAGVPPMMGFVGKETLLEAFIVQPFALIVIVSSSIFQAVLALRLLVDVFLGKQPVPVPDNHSHSDDPQHPLGDEAQDYGHHHALPALMVAGPALLAGFSVVLGLGITPLIEPLVEPAVGKDISLYLFPPYGINLAFMLSMTVLALGTVLFFARRFLLGWSISPLFTGPQLYRAAIAAVEGVADILLRSQGGKIRYYLVAILLSVVLLLLRVITDVEQMGMRSLSITLTSVTDALKVLLLVLALGATLASIVFERHLLAALSLGIAGYAIGGIFLLEPAPDVALVQFLVETLATVLIIVILARTSEEERSKAMSRVWGQTPTGLVRDLIVSVALGSAVAVFALAAVGSRPTPNPIASWYVQNAFPELGVNDVVAGIITDFRGTDTLLEITVFGMAALGILTLLSRPNPGKTMRLPWQKFKTVDTNEMKDAIQEDAERPESLVYRSRFNDPITRITAIPVLPISMMIALGHILYAGAAPGDGFTAGVIWGLGITLWFVVFGYEETHQRLGWLNPGAFIGFGLLIAFVNALLPLLFGREFIAFSEITSSALSDIKLASSLVFEIGICLTVFGGISAILEAITHPREVESL